VKVLVIGLDNSGKSTIINQVRSTVPVQSIALTLLDVNSFSLS